MKTEWWYFRLGIIVVAAVFLSGCSELKNGSQTTNPVFVYVHPEGFKSASSPDFHGIAIKNSGWEIRTCRQCHGGTYTGSNAISCISAGCHVDANGNPKSPESCNTCHGTFAGAASDTMSWLPPRSIAGDTGITARGVGAHQFHLIPTSMDLSTPLACVSCHSIPTSVYIPGHFDLQSPSPFVFAEGLARTQSSGLTPSPIYDSQSLRCSNTYCHGNWQLQKSTSPTAYQFVYTDSVITGANHSVQWTGGALETACGTCHGLPPSGHLSQGITTSNCTSCHYLTNQNGPLDKSIHINGKIDLYGHEYDFR